MKTFILILSLMLSANSFAEPTQMKKREVAVNFLNELLKDPESEVYGKELTDINVRRSRLGLMVTNDLFIDFLQYMGGQVQFRDVAIFKLSDSTSNYEFKCSLNSLCLGQPSNCAKSKAHYTFEFKECALNED